MLEAGRRARLSFRDQLEDGKAIGLELDLTSNEPLGLTVSTWPVSTDEPVELEVRMCSLSDRSAGPRITLAVKGQNLRVALESGQCRKASR